MRGGVSLTDRTDALDSVVNDIYTLFQQFGRIEHLEAITYHRQALNLCPPGHPDHSTSLHNLANAVKTRFEQLGSTGDLERQSCTIVKPSISFLPAILIVQLPSTILLRQSRLALSSWEAWKIWKRQSHTIIKPSISVDEPANSLTVHFRIFAFSHTLSDAQE
jgi:hypothetical protein